MTETVLRETHKGQRSQEAQLIEEYANQDDEQLFDAIISGNLEALEVFYDRYANKVYSLAVQVLRDSGAAEEVTQDVFLKVWHRASSYRAEKGIISSWLFSIARYRAIDELRRWKRKGSQDQYGLDLTNSFSDQGNDPYEHAALQFERIRIEEALTKLKLEQREVVVLAYFGGLTHKEIAEHLGDPLGTVKTRMRLALKWLREYLSPRMHEGVESDGSHV